MHADGRPEGVRVAVIDGDVDSAVLGAPQAAPAAPTVLVAARFAPAVPTQRPPVPERLAHGSDVAQLILAAAPDAVLLSAQVFVDGRPASVDTVADAIHWSVDQGARLINLSLGLREDRWALRHACACAHAAGVLLVASMPARGAVVYPAAYPGVVAVCGDARCRPHAWSQVAPRLFGACPAAPEARHGTREPGVPIGGASYAAARVSGLAAHWLGHLSDNAYGTAASPPGHLADRLIAYLAAGAAYRGRERHLSEHAL